MRNATTYKPTALRNGSTRARAVKGILFIIIGVALMLRMIPETNFLMPDWIVGPHTLLILLGIYKGFKHQFSNVGWLLLIIAGSLLAFPYCGIADYQTIILYGVPFSLILVGLFFIFNN